MARVRGRHVCILSAHGEDSRWKVIIIMGGDPAASECAWKTLIRAKPALNINIAHVNVS